MLAVAGSVGGGVGADVDVDVCVYSGGLLPLSHSVALCVLSWVSLLCPALTFPICQCSFPFAETNMEIRRVVLEKLCISILDTSEFLPSRETYRSVCVGLVGSAFKQLKKTGQVNCTGDFYPCIYSSCNNVLLHERPNFMMSSRSFAIRSCSFLSPCIFAANCAPRGLLIPPRNPSTPQRAPPRYVLVDPEAETPDRSLKATPLDRQQPLTSDWMSALPPPFPTPSPSVPFARPDVATDLVRGTAAASLPPIVSSNIFDGRLNDAAAAGVPATTVPVAMETVAVAVAVSAVPDAERFSPPPHSHPSALSAGSSPPGGVDTGALYEGSLRQRRSRIGSRGRSKSGSDNNWADKRADKTIRPMGRGGGGGGVETRGKGGGRAGEAASSGGSLWMQAAAAVEKKSTVSGSSGRGLGTSGKTSGKSPGSDSMSGSGGGGGGTIASMTGYGTGMASTGGGGSSVQSGSAGGRRRHGRGSASSTDDADSVSSSSWAEGADADLRSSQQQQQQQQHRWGGDASVMAAAAEEAAALNAAKDHPEAKRAETRMLAAQAKVNHAFTVLERRLVSLVTRQAPVPSPRLTATPAAARARHGFSSTYSSPRGSRSPCAPSLGEEQQPQRWAAVAPTGAAAATAPLAAAAALLMERAWSFRKNLLISVDKLRERSVALAVAEVSGVAEMNFGGGGGGGGCGTAAATAAVAGTAVISSAAVAGAAAGSATGVGGGWVPAQGNQSPPALTAAARRFPLSDRHVFAVGTADEEHRGLRGDGLRGEGAAESTVGGVAGSLALHRAGDTEREEPRSANAAAAGGALLGMSCCLDFDRILGDDSLLPGSGGWLPGHDQNEERVVGSPVSSPLVGSMDRSGPASGRGVVVIDRPQVGFGRTAMQSGGDDDGGSAGGLSARERWHSDDPPRVGVLAPDAWALVLRDVSAAEELCREFVSSWESAGGALGEACDDLEGDGVRGLTGMFTPQ